MSEASERPSLSPISHYGVFSTLHGMDGPSNESEVSFQELGNRPFLVVIPVVVPRYPNK
jgi:hypothetical protein